MGGAIFNRGGTVDVSNCTFTGNTATGGSGNQNGQGLGGAVFNYNGTSSIINCTFSGNTANDGGAIHSLGDGGTASVALNNSILANSSSGNDFVGNTINSGASTTACRSTCFTARRRAGPCSTT